LKRSAQDERQGLPVASEPFGAESKFIFSDSLGSLRQQPWAGSQQAGVQGQSEACTVGLTLRQSASAAIRYSNGHSRYQSEKHKTKRIQRRSNKNHSYFISDTTQLQKQLSRKYQCSEIISKTAFIAFLHFKSSSACQPGSTTAASNVNNRQSGFIGGAFRMETNIPYSTKN